MPRVPRRTGMFAAGWIFTVLGALIVVFAGLAVLGETQTHDTYGLPWAVGFMVALAACTALYGRRLIRESTAEHLRHRRGLRAGRPAGAWACFLISGLLGLVTVIMVVTWATTGKLSDPAGLVYPISTSMAFAQFGRVLLANRRSEPAMPDREEAESAPGGAARYREACSNVNVVATLAAVALLGLGVWVVAAFGGPGGKAGPQGFLVMVPVIPGLWLLLAVFALPYGIVLRENWLQLGVRGVPRAGRMWLRARVPLDAVISWDVVGIREFKKHKERYRPVPGKPAGAMPGMLVRHVLWVRADPRAVSERYPDFVLRTSYEMASASSLGLVQNGLLYIGTRRPRALARAMEDVLPGKRLPAGRPAD